MNLAARIRSVPDFPVPGILFRDITPLLADPAALAEAVRQMTEPWRGAGIDLVAAMEARGFMFGAAMAIELGAGFVPVRKAGKLPRERIAADYVLEYGTATLELHADSVLPGQRVLVVDDVLATGGTLGAAISLVERLGGVVVAVSVVVELAGLGGRERIAPHTVHALWIT